MSKWNFETTVEACRQLDAERLEMGEMLPINSRDIQNYDGDLDIPSWETVREYVGTKDELLKELGRVTAGIAVEWTKEQWKENAHWVKDIMTERGIDSITAHTTTDLVRAGLMPGVKAIEAIWGNFQTYRLKNGIEPRPLYVRAQKWNKDQSIKNGRVYADKLGKDFGFPLMPKQDDIYAGSKAGKTPTIYQIEKIHNSLDEYQGDIGFVNYFVMRHRWTNEDWIDNFNWLCDVWREQGRDVTSINELLTIAGRLHIGPTIEAAVEKWGNLTGYAKHVGFETDQIKRRFSNEGVMRGIIQIVAREKRPITKEDFADDPDMGINMIKRRFGGVPKVNLRLGYITNTTGWNKDMLLWWGVTSFMPKHERKPRTRDLNEVSLADQGPSPTKIYREFDKSLDVFHEELDRADDWFSRQLERPDLTNRKTGGALSHSILKYAITRNPELFHPDKDISPDELEVFFQLRRAGVETTSLTPLMKNGIPFENPEKQLCNLANLLARGNALNSKVLKQLEPYIIGLAPPDQEMGWADFIKDYRSRSRQAA
jgi:hypothetical protein